MVFSINNIIIQRQLYRLLAYLSERSRRHIRKSLFILLVCLIPGSTYSMLEQETQEEEFKSKKTHILFLCTGNSCRLQMAEGWAR